MASLASLPPDQSAVIQLVLQQGRSYDQIAALLSIDRAGVRQRALDAFDALGPDNEIDAPRRALLTDYLLAQLPAAVADQVRSRIAATPAERTWLRVIASELAPLARSPLPQIPAPGAAAPAGAGTPAPASRRGGAIVLGVAGVLLAAIVAVVLVLVLSSSNSSASRNTAARDRNHTTSAATTSTASTSSKAKLVAQVNLSSPTGVKDRVGIAQVIGEGSALGIVLVAQHVPANITTKGKANAYAVWLYNSDSDCKLIGFVDKRVGSNGRLETEGGLPTNASHYKEMLVTLETQQKPTKPGQIILEGTLKLS